MNLALLTDGLRAEREQGITIDVAYRYFHTPRRKFIIADTPGHEQYTRNMVTGASTADLALILVDARKGVLEQSRRHAFIASLLRIPHLVVCVNKMDLVDHDQSVFDRITSDFAGWLAKLDIHDVTFIPISALHGDNVVERSEHMPWYEGPSLLYHLEHVHVASDRNLRDPRFPVQWVVRPMTDEHHDYRGYAGEVASGVLRPGDEVVVLPSGRTTRIASIDAFEGELEEAYPPLSVTLRLEDDIDVSRGDMICRPENRPTEAREIDAMVCWMSERPLSPSARYRIKHTVPHGAGQGGRGALPDRRELAAPRRRTPAGSSSTRSGACGCGCPRRCSWTSTGATAPPAASSSSTSRRTTPSVRAWCFREVTSWGLAPPAPVARWPVAGASGGSRPAPVARWPRG